MSAETKTRRVMTFVCLVLFFDAMGAGLIMPVMPQLIEQLSTLPAHRAAIVSGYLLFTYAAMQFVCAPILGGLSDRFGRRPVLLLSLLGFSIDYFIIALAPSLAFLFVARIVSGLFGATYSAANAAIADISAPADRAKLFGLSGAAVGLGFVFGPAIGGMAGSADPRLPFIVAGALMLISCLYGFFAFPETLAQSDRRAFTFRRANPIGSIASVARHPAVLMLLLGLFCIQLSAQSYSSTWAFYAMEVTGWSPLGVGLSIALYGLTIVIVQGTLVGPAIKRFGEHTMLRFGVTLGVISYLCLATGAGPMAIYAGVVIGALGQFVGPAAQSLMTQQIAVDSQGELQGALGASNSFAAIIGPLIMAHIYGAASDNVGPHMPGAPFALAALLVMTAALLFVLSRQRETPRAAVSA
jgi:DHA1 family tetracycline resistance protein-like MFS transporter